MYIIARSSPGKKTMESISHLVCKKICLRFDVRVEKLELDLKCLLGGIADEWIRAVDVWSGRNAGDPLGVEGIGNPAQRLRGVQRHRPGMCSEVRSLRW